MKIGIKKEVEVEAKTISIHAKCRNSCSLAILDQDNKVIKEHDGYVPHFMPGDHNGDYLMLEIDIDTGVIKNWPKITYEQIQNFCTEEEE